MLFVLIIGAVVALIAVVSWRDWRDRRRGVRGTTGVDGTGVRDQRRMDEAELHMRNAQLRDGGGSLPF